MRVNGELLPQSAPLEMDKAERGIPRNRIDGYKPGEAELLLMGEASDTSFDGRYFGPVKNRRSGV
jgi:type IV secretory pathway protease TraF